jgi:purine-nucleoside phosphorylase
MQQVSLNAIEVIKARAGAAPINVGVIMGTGLAAIADHIAEPVSIPYTDLPGFPLPRIGAEVAAVVVGKIGTARIAVMKGRSHYYETGDINAMRAPLETLKGLGAEAVLIVCFCASTRADLGEGALVAVRDHINLTGLNPLVADPDRGRFSDMTMAYDPTLRERFTLAASQAGRRVNEATLMWFPGPTFETRAEIKAASQLGADVVGFSLVPEVLRARALGLRVLGLSIVSNMATGVRAGRSDSDSAIRVGAATVSSMTRILTKFFEIWTVGSKIA